MHPQVIVKIGAYGGIILEGTIDLYDPNPEKSNGLIRPFELLSSGSSPLEWFEFGIKISVKIKVYIKVMLASGCVVEILQSVAFQTSHFFCLDRFLSSRRLDSSLGLLKSKFGNTNILFLQSFSNSRCVAAEGLNRFVLSLSSNLLKFRSACYASDGVPNP